jgi:hypothetical protein
MYDLVIDKIAMIESHACRALGICRTSNISATQCEPQRLRFTKPGAGRAGTPLAHRSGFDIELVAVIAFARGFAGVILSAMHAADSNLPAAFVGPPQGLDQGPASDRPTGPRT